MDCSIRRPTTWPCDVIEPGGFEAISRGPSVATPPEWTRLMIDTNLEGWQRLCEPFGFGEWIIAKRDRGSRDYATPG
jgi:hypothetical protein